MTSRSLRIWSLVHKWSSLACTLFLLVICVTGLPLVFRDEISVWLSTDPPYAIVPRDAPRESLDYFVEQARDHHPSEVIRFISIDDDEPKIIVALAPTPNADPRHNRLMKFDAHAGVLLNDAASADPSADFLNLMLRLHTDLFAGLAGELFLGSMALVFVAAIVSGIVLYAPFMRRLEFGTIRRDRSRLTKWLDIHNLIAVTTLAWALVVGLTGALNEVSQPLFNVWRATDLATMLKAYHDKPNPEHLSSVQGVFDRVHEEVPGRMITSILFPSTMLGIPHHYVVWTKGDRPLTSRLFTPVLVDAETGAVTAVADLPWYLRALEVSRPLHFGDYGGMPLKIIWAALDLVTIGVLLSGLYLWLARRKFTEKDPAREDANSGFEAAK